MSVSLGYVSCHSNKQADEYLNKVIAAHKAKKRLEDELYESLQIKKIKEVMEEWNRIQALMDAMRGVYRVVRGKYACL
jgi:Tfp pilus assembly protein PilP